ncbi:unnamed protein product [Enterobius vermicularis]|uniref:C-type lectin domain-containing protein n=1 Tax=Enterobius vermicularis TaxID=51028 RepID=A0A0N4UT44_ENTVE|nr:unnamed protein product [Enterobius vermicularis]
MPLPETSEFEEMLNSYNFTVVPGNITNGKNEPSSGEPFFNYKTAVELCRTYGADAVSLNSADEEDFVKKLAFYTSISKLNPNELETPRRVLLGLHGSSTKNLVWSDSSSTDYIVQRLAEEKITLSEDRSCLELQRRYLAQQIYYGITVL